MPGPKIYRLSRFSPKPGPTARAKQLPNKRQGCLERETNGKFKDVCPSKLSTYHIHIYICNIHVYIMYIFYHIKKDIYIYIHTYIHICIYNKYVQVLYSSTLRCAQLRHHRVVVNGRERQDQCLARLGLGGFHIPRQLKGLKDGSFKGDKWILPSRMVQKLGCNQTWGFAIA